MTSTFLKQFIESKENMNLLTYYCSIRLNPFLNIRQLPRVVAYTSPKYFTDLISIARKMSHNKYFPNINSNIIYQSLLPECIPLIENKINLCWKKSWKNLNFKYINIREREIMYKHMHGILPTKLKLFQIKQSVSPLCDRCNVVEDNLHMFSQCQKVQVPFRYFLYLLNKVCNVENFNIQNVLYLDTQNISRQKRNTLVVITSTFISTIWFNRDTEPHIESSVIRTKILSQHSMLKIILKEKMNFYFTEQYCNLLKY